MLERISILPVDKTVVFFTPLEGNDTIVRTGTIGEGSCAYHSILHGCDSKYVSLDISQRMKYVKEFRASLSDSITRGYWESLGLVAKLPYQENVSRLLTEFYKFTKDNAVRDKALVDILKKMNIKNIEVYRIMVEIVSCDRLEKHILPQAYEKMQDKSISDCNKYVLSLVKDYVDARVGDDASRQEKKIQITQVILSFLQNVFDHAEDEAYNAYIKDVGNANEEVDTFSLNLIADKVDRDMYFIDGTTRMPYNNCSTAETLKGRKSIILLWVGESHYEILGRLLKGRKVQREFTHDDPLIVKLKMFLLQPEKIESTYPELSSYLPKTHRPKSNLIVHNSHSSDADEASSESSESDFDSECSDFSPSK
jgi:hypothetical protein